MADPTSSKLPVAAPPTRSTRPMSEALLNEKVCKDGTFARCPANDSADAHAQRGRRRGYEADYVLILYQQWDHCMSTLLIRSTLGASFGIIFSVLLFKRRAWPVFTGLGFGAGRAWEECDSVGPDILRSIAVPQTMLRAVHYRILADTSI